MRRTFIERGHCGEPIQDHVLIATRHSRTGWNLKKNMIKTKLALFLYYMLNKR